MPSRRQAIAVRFIAAGVLLSGLFLDRLNALTLADLMAEQKVTAHRFANHFGDFAFEYGDRVQPADVFLSREKGDCDDYAILGDYVLSRKGFATHLIHVHLVGRGAHDICYVVQEGCYLDYNLRLYFRNTQHSGRSLREIANRVADSFNANWTTVSVYTYTYQEDVKHLTMTVVKTEPPSDDPDRTNPL